MTPLKARAFRIGRAATIADDFEQTLLRAGVRIAPGSALEQMALELYRITDERENPGTVQPSADLPLRYAKGLGLAELAGQLCSVRDHPAFGQLAHHLELLNVAREPQNMRSPTFDDAANRLFELLVSCWVMQLTPDVEVEQPGEKRPNPDVLARINGKLWGIACKTPYSSAPDSLFENVRKGVYQLERAGVAAGVVFVNTRNLIDHKRYWFPVPTATPTEGPAWSAFNRGQDAYELLLLEAQEIWNGLARARGEEVLRRLFRHRGPVVPGIAAWSQVTAGVVLDGTPRAALVQVGSFSFVRKPAAWQLRVLHAIKGRASANPTAPPVDSPA